MKSIRDRLALTSRFLMSIPNNQFLKTFKYLNQIFRKWSGLNDPQADKQQI